MHRRHTGFTLIELMIVVAIIAILLAMAIPSLQSSRIAAEESAAIASLRSLHAEVGLYRARFGYWPADFAALQAAGYAQSFVSNDGSRYARKDGEPRLGAFLAFTLPRKGKYFYAYGLGDPLGIGGSWSVLALPPDGDYRGFAINEAGRIYFTNAAGETPQPLDP